MFLDSFSLELIFLEYTVPIYSSSRLQRQTCHNQITRTKSLVSSKHPAFKLSLRKTNSIAMNFKSKRYAKCPYTDLY